MSTQPSSPSPANQPISFASETEGTFSYPAGNSTFETLLRFWSTVEVPEGVLVRLHRGASRARKQAIQENPELAKKLPILYPTAVRALARIFKMGLYAGGLSGAEREKFDNARFTLPTGLSGTVDELREMFLADKYANQAVSAAETDDHDDLVKELRSLRAELTEALAGQQSAIVKQLAQNDANVREQLVINGDRAEHRLKQIANFQSQTVYYYATGYIEA